MPPFPPNVGFLYLAGAPLAYHGVSHANAHMASEHMAKAPDRVLRGVPAKEIWGAMATVALFLAATTGVTKGAAHKQGVWRVTSKVIQAKGWALILPQSLRRRSRD